MLSRTWGRVRPIFLRSVFWHGWGHGSVMFGPFFTVNPEGKLKEHNVSFRAWRSRSLARSILWTEINLQCKVLFILGAPHPHGGSQEPRCLEQLKGMVFMTQPQGWEALWCPRAKLTNVFCKPKETTGWVLTSRTGLIWSYRWPNEKKFQKCNVRQEMLCSVVKFSTMDIKFEVSRSVVLSLAINSENIKAVCVCEWEYQIRGETRFVRHPQGAWMVSLMLFEMVGAMWILKYFIFGWLKYFTIL